MNIKLTVILPVYNGSKYLNKSINSVLSQTYTNFEFIIVDDASIDNSYEICAAFKDQRIKLFRNEINLGLFSTLNSTISKTKNDYIYLWAQDDIMTPDCLLKFVEYIENTPEAGFYYCDFFSIDQNDNKTNKDKLFFDVRERTPQIANPKQSALLFFYFGCLPGNISTVLINKRAWEFYKGFSENKKAAPDFEMWLNISQSFNICFINHKLVEIREHSEQQSVKSHSDLSSIEEEIDLNKLLFSRVKNLLSENEIKEHFLYNRGRQYFHWIMKVFLKGNFSKAYKSIVSLKNYGSITYQFIVWLMTLNGRFFMPRSLKIFDKKLSLIINNDFKF
jgi:glycosyltransferase involved in cell wall biosynthesis